MPIKYNLTKYDILANRIHKLSLKGLRNGTSADPVETEDVGEDEQLKTIAIILASFTSSHSWQTYRCIEQQADGFNSEIVKSEYLEAVKERWKHVTSSDVSELANLKVSDSDFHRWLFFNVGNNDQEKYKEAWSELKETLSEPCDDTQPQPTA